MKNCSENCGLILRAFRVVFQQVSGARKSFHTAPIASHRGTGWVLWVWSSSALEPRSRCGSKIGYRITLTRISSSFWWKIRHLFMVVFEHVRLKEAILGGTINFQALWGTHVMHTRVGVIKVHWLYILYVNCRVEMLVTWRQNAA